MPVGTSAIENISVCKFVESGKTIGLLNLEKEITGDIVQGLPRIEEILEARKKNTMIKRIPTSQKTSLLSQKTSLDINYMGYIDINIYNL